MTPIFSTKLIENVVKRENTACVLNRRVSENNLSVC